MVVIPHKKKSITKSEDIFENVNVDTGDDEVNFETCDEAHNRMAVYRVLPELVRTK